MAVRGELCRFIRSVWDLLVQYGSVVCRYSILGSLRGSSLRLLLGSAGFCVLVSSQGIQEIRSTSYAYRHTLNKSSILDIFIQSLLNKTSTSPGAQQSTRIGRENVPCRNN